MNKIVKKPRSIEGVFRLPPDKSISHRVVLFNAIAGGSAQIFNYSTSLDCQSTLACLTQLGASIESHTTPNQQHNIKIHQAVLNETSKLLDAGNSGTTLRLLTGFLASQPFSTTITGDSSLRKRPMGRIIEPLTKMGANISGESNNTLAPLNISGQQLNGIEYYMPIASAQVKSAILLAGLFANGKTIVHQPLASRNHTELLLASMGASIVVDDLTVSIESKGKLQACDITIPGDISAASFWLVAGTIHPNAKITLEGVGANPSRIQFIETLQAMGARITINPYTHLNQQEPVCDLTIESSELRSISIGRELIPGLIDEIPALALAACFAEGTSTIEDAGELRFKESDRIKTTVSELSKLGATIRELPNGIKISGKSTLDGAICSSHGDHRIAMMTAIAGLLSSGETIIQEAESASVSDPTFWHRIDEIQSS